MHFSEIIHDPSNQQFRMMVGNQIAKIDYSKKNGKLYLLHSEVPRSLRGQGVGKVLVEKTFEYIEENDMEAVAVCSFIRIVAQRSTKWREIIG